VNPGGNKSCTKEGEVGEGEGAGDRKFDLTLRNVVHRVAICS
jgi:hypothetical protein